VIQGHGGNIFAVARLLGCRPGEIIDMSSNINPLGVPPGLREHLLDHLDRIGVLPEVDSRTAVAHMAALLDVDTRRMLAGNGTTQFIYTVCPALDAQKVLIVGPTYADYADACRMHRLEPSYFLADATAHFEVHLDMLDQGIKGFDTVFICNPNNPTGTLIPCEALIQLCRANPHTHFIIDESYLPFAPSDQLEGMAGSMAESMAACELENVSVLWSFSKIFGSPGLRAGFLIANEATIDRFQRYMQPWSLNSLAQAAIDYLGHNRGTVMAFVENTRRYLAKERLQFRDDLASVIAITLYPSVTSYILIGLPQGFNAEGVYQHMAQKRILIRNCSNFHGLSNRFVRVALKDSPVNRTAAGHLVEHLQQPGI
jgi:threonine-phosphate decarboxylase